MTIEERTLTSPFNRCNLPPWIIGSADFQEEPRDIEIEGVRQTDVRLFQRLASLATPEERSEVFHDYLSVKFRLHELNEHTHAARACLRHSYIHLIRAWGSDSNGHAGAMLKSWVESRFGLRVTYHKGRLRDEPEAIVCYLKDRLRGAAKVIGASMQLDLLYAYCQDELRRRHPGERWLTLYRGTHDPEEYAVRSGVAVRDASLVELNNLSSFTSDPEIAWEFGSSVWQVRVPCSKIVFFSGLLPRRLLEGEAEYLVLGGTYRVKALKY